MRELYVGVHQSAIDHRQAAFYIVDLATGKECQFDPEAMIWLCPLPAFGALGNLVTEDTVDVALYDVMTLFFIAQVQCSQNDHSRRWHEGAAEMVRAVRGFTDPAVDGISEQPEGSVTLSQETKDGRTHH